MQIQYKELPNGEIFEQACIVVKSILVSMEDMEEINQEGFCTFVSIPKCSATIYVWPDETAFKHRASPIHWYRIEVECDLDNNIFQQAYEKLKG